MDNGQVEEATAQLKQVEHVKIQQLASGNWNFSVLLEGRKNLGPTSLAWISEVLYLIC